ncbi:MAG TPA: hypothetical protein VK191_13805 [Symbiobacteriaceae bacterium]|nr:hypothetical protein [Symbiobacteriaceae bacterium]
MIARTAEQGYLADRSSSRLFQWDRHRYELVGAMGSRLVFEEVSDFKPGPGAFDGRWGPTNQQTFSGKFT